MKKQDISSVQKHKFLASLREKLLDLSLRNNLLNFHSKSTRVVKIVNELPDQIYTYLVENQKQMTLIPSKEGDGVDGQPNTGNKNSNQLNLFEISQDRTVSNPNTTKKNISKAVKSVETETLEQQDEIQNIESSGDPELPEDKGFEKNKNPEFYDEFLQTDLVEERLDGRMRRINNDYKNILDSTGSNMLFLAVGFLEWYDTTREPEKARYAPLILIPINLQRTLVEIPNENDEIVCVYRYKISFTGDDISNNLALTLKLRKDFNLELPSISENGIDSPEAYFNLINKLLKRWKAPTNKKWRIARYIRLGFFTYNKDVIYRDLDPKNWPETDFVNIPLVSTVIAGATPESPCEIRLEEVEKIQRTGEIPTIMDADSSQLKVLIAVAKGKNLVVQGPPGTGKSQTIANLIASALHSGKTVLFMAEKLAALEVVQTRLKKAMLHPYCLELHSKSSNLNNVHLQIRTRLNTKAKKSAKQYLWEFASKINNFRDTLNCHCGLMSTIMPGIDCDIATLFWRFELSKINLKKLLSSDDNTFEVPVLYKSDKLPSINDLANLKDSFEIIETHINEEIPQKCSAWEGFIPENLTQDKVNSIQEILLVLIANANEIKSLQESSSFSELIRYPLVDLNNIYAILSKIPLPDVGFCQGIAIDISISNVTTSDFKNHIEDLNFLQQHCGSAAAKLSKNKDFTGDFFNSAIKCLENLIATYGECGNCWDSIQQLSLNLKDAQFRVDTLLKTVLEIKSVIGIELNSAYISDVLNIINFIEELLNTSNDVIEVITTFPPNTNTIKNYELAKKQYDLLQTKKINLSQLFDIKNAPNPEYIAAIRAEIRSSRNTWKEWLPFGQYVRAKKQLRRFAKTKAITTDATLAALEELANLPEEEMYYENEQNFIRNIGSYFKGCRTNWNLLDIAIACYKKIDQFALIPEDSHKIRQQLTQLDENRDTVRKSINTIKNSLTGLDALLVTAKNALRINFNEDKLADIGAILADYIVNIHEKVTELKSIIVDPAQPFTNLINDICIALEIRTTNAKIQAFLKKADNYAKDVPVNPMPAIEAMEHTVSWIETFYTKTNAYSCICKYILNNDTISRLKTLIFELANINDKIITLCEQAKTLRNYGRISSGSCFSNEITKDTVAVFLNALNRALQALPLLLRWADYQRCIIKIEELGAAHIIEFSKKIKDISTVQFLPNLVEVAFYRQWTEFAMKTYPVLWEFDRITHEITRSKFARFDKDQLNHYQEQVIRNAHELGQDAPQGISYGAVGNFTDLGLISHELEKKKRHIPVRELIRRSYSALQKLMPCWMMSPASVSQFIPPETIQFDLLIMDEASQIRPEDAIGSLARAKQVVVVGDTNQMPPTDVFTTTLTQDSDEYSAAEDMKSILDLLTQYLPNETLRWHYRSQHHHLIQFSNERYYDRALIIPPSSFIVNPSLGIKLHYLPDALYYKGINPVEGAAIVEHVSTHIKQAALLPPNEQESIGIVVMNANQRDLVDELWDDSVQKDNKLRAAMERYQPSEGLFIRNLENVQGDERDVILIGFTYGPDSSTKKVFQRFGPINKDGGWRRLNVLFSRSRKRIHVFTSMRSNDISPTKGESQRGCADLRAYLEFAETGYIPGIIEKNKNEPDSEFEEAVAAVVTSFGYDAYFQVGVDGFRIDIGVCHPSNPHCYICGIECDGAPYHSHPVARDRDRLREEIIRARGWDIYRIWSTDWYRNRLTEVERLQEYLRIRTECAYKN